MSQMSSKYLSEMNFEYMIDSHSESESNLDYESDKELKYEFQAATKVEAEYQTQPELEYKIQTPRESHDEITIKYYTDDFIKFNKEVISYHIKHNPSYAQFATPSDPVVFNHTVEERDTYTTNLLAQSIMLNKKIAALEAREAAIALKESQLKSNPDIKLIDSIRATLDEAINFTTLAKYKYLNPPSASDNLEDCREMLRKKASKLDDREYNIKNIEEALKTREKNIDALEINVNTQKIVLEELDSDLNDFKDTLIGREYLLDEREEALIDREQLIIAREEALNQREQNVIDSETHISKIENDIYTKELELGEREGLLITREDNLEERLTAIFDKEQSLREKEYELQKISDKFHDRVNDLEQQQDLLNMYMNKYNECKAAFDKREKEFNDNLELHCKVLYDRECSAREVEKNIEICRIAFNNRIKSFFDECVEYAEIKKFKNALQAFRDVIVSFKIECCSSLLNEIQTRELTPELVRSVIITSSLRILAKLNEIDNNIHAMTINHIQGLSELVSNSNDDSVARSEPL